MIGRAMSQFVGLRPSMGGSVILTHWAAALLLVRVRLWLESVIRFGGGLLMARDEMTRKWRKSDRRSVGRCRCMTV